MNSSVNGAGFRMALPGYRRTNGARIQIRNRDMLAIVRIGVRCQLHVAGAGNKVQIGMRRNKQ